MPLHETSSLLPFASFLRVGTEFPSRSNLREEGLIFIWCFGGRPFHHDGKSGKSLGTSCQAESRVPKPETKTDPSIQSLVSGTYAADEVTVSGHNSLKLAKVQTWKRHEFVKDSPHTDCNSICPHRWDPTSPGVPGCNTGHVSFSSIESLLSSWGHSGFPEPERHLAVSSCPLQGL